jgi:hypothetical protein
VLGELIASSKVFGLSFMTFNFIVRLIGEKNAHLMSKAPNLAW